MTRRIVVNGNDRDIYKKWSIGVGDIGTTWFCVYADNEQDAIDEIVDYCEEHGMYGFFADDDEVYDWYDESSDDYESLQDKYIVAGNHSRLFTNEIHFE